MMDLKIFVDTDADIRLLRRITRDIMERGRDVEGVLKSYNRFVRQAYIDFIKPVSIVSFLLTRPF
jgi:uridine kinase